MSKKKNMNAAERTAETARKIRKDWGAGSGVTKVIPDKRRKAPKYKRVEGDE